MSRVTPTQLRATVARLANSGHNISIQWAYGRPRIYDRDGARELSPRLSTGEMAIWLDGYDSGLTAAWNELAGR